MPETISFDIIARDLASKAFKDAGGAAEGFHGKLAAVAGLATGAFGGAITKMGEHLEETRNVLKQTIDNAGESFGQFAGQIDKAVGHEERFGHSSADTNEALSELVRSTGSTKGALSDLSLATEIAAAHHSSLSEAAQTVAKMHAGAMRPLKEFGISADAVAAKAQQLALAHGDSAKQEMFAAAQTLILQKIQGTAAAQAETFGGKVKALKTHLGDMAAELGAKVGPALTVLGPALAGVGGIMSTDLGPKLGKIATGFADFAKDAIKGFAEAAAGAVEWATTTTISIGAVEAPLLPFIAAVAAVGVAGYLLYRNWDTIWGFIKTIVRDAVGFVTDHLTLILTVALGPIGFAIGELATHWDTVWGGVQSTIETVWKFIQPIFKELKRAIDDIAGPLGKVAGAAGGLLKAGGSVLSHVPGFADGGYIPGYVGQPQLALVHGGELVLNPAQQRAGLGGPGAPFIGHFEQHVHTKDDPRRIAVSVNRGLRDLAFLTGM